MLSVKTILGSFLPSSSSTFREDSNPTYFIFPHINPTNSRNFNITNTKLAPSLFFEMSAGQINSFSNPFGLASPLPTLATLQAERRRLPVSQHLTQFQESFEKNDIVIVSSETGSGKTTQIPQYVAFLARQAKLTGLVACTQPRRLVATRVAERVAQEAGCELGVQVGCQIRGQDLTSGETRLMYVDPRERSVGCFR